MMDITQIISPQLYVKIGYVVSITLLVLTILNNLIFVLPRLYELAKVKNGLFKLRRRMLQRTILSTTAAIFALIALIARFIVSAPWTTYVIVSVVILFCFSKFIFSIIERFILREQYTREQRDLHERMSIEEEKMKRSKSK